MTRINHAPATGGLVGRLLLSACLAALPGVAMAQQSGVENGGDTSRVADTPLPDAAKVNVGDEMMARRRRQHVGLAAARPQLRQPALFAAGPDQHRQCRPAGTRRPWCRPAWSPASRPRRSSCDGVMYLSTPMVDDQMKVMAVDAATGETLLDHDL